MSALLFLMSLFQLAQAADESCSLMLWVTDPDPKGLNIRATPDGSAKVIGTLPKSTEFTAINSKNGWIQFKKPIAFGPDLPWVPITTGPLTGKAAHTGWVHPENQCPNQVTTCP